MTKASLKAVSDAMTALNLSYALREYDATSYTYPYWVGDYTEINPDTEDGLQASTFMLTGTTRGTWLELETAKESIRAYFGLTGKEFIAADGSVAVISYSSADMIPSDDENLKRMQINLDIKEWMVNI